MKLIIILFCLALERYLNIGTLLRRFAWFDDYLNYAHALLTKNNLWEINRGTLATLLIIIPFPIMATLLCLICWYLLRELGTFVVGAAVLLYCLGPQDLYEQLKAYVTAMSQGDQSLVREEQAKLTSTSGLESGNDKSLVREILWQANERIFAVLFWFSILGPFGALFYRVTSLLHQASEKTNSPYQNLQPVVSQLHQILDWLPVRLFSMGYALAGNFTKSFARWFDYVLSGLSSNRQMLVECGEVAIDNTPGALEGAEGTNAAMSLIDRTLILFLVIVAIFTIGSWIY